jgi:hypothetical protein
MQPAQLTFLSELVLEPPSPWELMAKGLRETNEPQGERVEYLRQQVRDLNQGKKTM